MTLHKGNYYKWRQSRQLYAAKTVLGRIAHIREVLLLTVDLRGFQGNGSKYGRLRGNVEHGCWEVEARKLESSNTELGSWNVDAGTWIQESRTRKRVPSKSFSSKRRLGRGSVAKRSWGGSPRHRTDPACPGGRCLARAF